MKYGENRVSQQYTDNTKSPNTAHDVIKYNWLQGHAVDEMLSNI